jgi:hypothetical protein
VAWERFCFATAAEVIARYGELAALGLLESGALLFDMADRERGTGDSDTAAM